MFYRSRSGREPVREWLRGLPRDDMRAVGRDIKTAQYGWPLGMPLVRKLQPGLWEVRSNVRHGVARVLFTVEGSSMILLHGFHKTSEKTPLAELATARRRRKRLREGW